MIPTRQLARRLARLGFAGLAVATALALCGTAAAAGADGRAASATITYKKVFVGSAPEFVEIRVTESGAGTWDVRQLSDDADPQPLQVSPVLAQKMFELAAQMNHFRGVELDVRRKIANLGEKTFRYESGSESHEVKFNYTLHPAASQLQMIFEGLARQQEHLQKLMHAMRFDRLGVQKALLNFEADFDRKVIPEPQRFLPVLQQLADDSRYVEISRQRARALIEKIKAAP